MSDEQQESWCPTRRHCRRTSFAQREILTKLVLVDGKTTREAAEVAGVNASTARNIINAYKREGSNTQRTCGGNNREKLTPNVLQRVEEAVERHSEDTLVQLQMRLREDGINLSVSSVSNTLRRLKITLKKCHYELDRVNGATTIASRQAYALEFSAHAPSNKEKCIFIDESGFNLHLRRTQARSRRGTRANVVLPTVRGRMVTLIVAMNNQGVIHSKIINDGTCNGAKFSAFVEELVARISCIVEMNGAWLIMDNARIHMPDELRRILGSSYHLQFLPPYSYMLNPVEHVFSKVKASARRLLINPTPEQTLSTVIQDSVGMVTQQDCMNCVLNTMMNLTKATAGQPFVN